MPINERPTSDSCKLAAIIEDAHIQTAEIESAPLPRETPPTIQPEPCRVYCGSINGLEWYYWINQNSVLSGLFFPQRSVHRYDEIRQRLNIEGHDFGEGIIGNGGNNGTTRKIWASTDRGCASPPEEWHEIAAESVLAMSRVYQRIQM